MAHGMICLLIALLAIFHPSHSIHRSPCPVSCLCHNSSSNVDCNDGFWNELPTPFKKVPNQPLFWLVKVEGGEFGQLKQPKDCALYSKIHGLTLRKNRITSVAVDAFFCMPKMNFLVITLNYISQLEPDTFKPLTQLTSLNLASNFSSSAFFQEICKLSLLQSLYIRKYDILIEANDTMCLKNLRNLKTVDISNCKPRPSLADILQNMKQIQWLFADWSGPLNLTVETFRGLSNLTQLVMRNSGIQHIDTLTFAETPKLSTINFNDNHLTAVNWLYTMPNVRAVHLLSNKLEQIPSLPASVSDVALGFKNMTKLANRSFTNLNNVELINLGQGRIQHVEKAAFGKLRKVKRLLLQDNPIETEGIKNVFENFANTSLMEIYFSNCILPTISSDIFEKYERNNLKRLHVIKCKVTEIRQEAFKNLIELTELDLSGNAIRALHGKTFHGLVQLQKLTMNDNVLKAIDWRAFDNQNLHSLHIQSNRIKSIGSMISGVDNLEILNLYGNRITILRDNIFNNTSKLKVLIMSKNNLHEIRRNALRSLKKIQLLVLTNNKILQEYVFNAETNNLKELNELDVDDNTGVCRHPLQVKNALQNTGKLEELRISSCGLETLLPGMFGGLTNLTRIQCNKNSLSFIDPLAFEGTPNLSFLSLIGNKITYVDSSTFRYVPHLRSLFLQENPLLCTCQVLWIVQSAKTQLLFFGANGLAGLKCDAKFRHPTVESLGLTPAQCERKWYEILQPLGISLASMVAATLLLVLLKYRWHLKYFMFLARAWRYKYKDLNNEREYLHDAFIAYSELDLDWVRDQMLPNIDEEYLGDKGFKVCLHHRDWRVGADIVDNIVLSIENSRRTIIVLSNNFASSQWCQFELATAQMKLDAGPTGGNVLLVILLSDIDAELLTPRLRCILSSKTYLPWSSDPHKQSIFWKVLRKALKKPLPDGARRRQEVATP